MKIYVASSWRNVLQPGIVHALRRCGHEVYDFRHPPGGTGFAWSSIDPDWRGWSAADYARALQNPIARAGYESDRNAIRECDACVLVLPAGRSAAWELGYATALGKAGYVCHFGDDFEPELMFYEATILASMNALFDAFGEPKP